jgi:hypothetical protein
MLCSFKFLNKTRIFGIIKSVPWSRKKLFAIKVCIHNIHRYVYIHSTISLRAKANIHTFKCKVPLVDFSKFLQIHLPAPMHLPFLITIQCLYRIGTIVLLIQYSPLLPGFRRRRLVFWIQIGGRDGWHVRLWLTKWALATSRKKSEKLASTHFSSKLPLIRWRSNKRWWGMLAQRSRIFTRFQRLFTVEILFGIVLDIVWDLRFVFIDIAVHIYFCRALFNPSELTKSKVIGRRVLVNWNYRSWLDRTETRRRWQSRGWGLSKKRSRNNGHWVPIVGSVESFGFACWAWHSVEERHTSKRVTHNALFRWRLPGQLWPDLSNFRARLDSNH